MKKMLILLAIITLAACKQPLPVQNVPEQAPVKQPKNIILMIGDGMGLTQITAGMYRNNDFLHLEEFKSIGLQKTDASDDLITDSAAGATAFACGQKTYNGAIAVDSDTSALKTILEEAEDRGFATGLVATSSITHATPASFIAHVAKRKQYEDIATFFLKTEVDYFVGGGKKFFDRRTSDDRNLYAELQANGYEISDYFKEDFTKLKIDPKKNFGYFTADEEPLPKTQGRDYLIPAVQEAVKFLDRHDETNTGFFLMIESSQIDWGGHANDAEYVITEMIEFDEAIGKVLDFAKKDGETLVIVTSDHETGGLAINPLSTRDTIKAVFTSTQHTASMVPVFAYGPGAEIFRGIYDNTAIYYKMKIALGFE